MNLGDSCSATSSLESQESEAERILFVTSLEIRILSSVMQNKRILLLFSILSKDAIVITKRGSRRTELGSFLRAQRQQLSCNVFLLTACCLFTYHFPPLNSGIFSCKRKQASSQSFHNLIIQIFCGQLKMVRSLLSIPDDGISVASRRL
jgi:hypothetical protein